MLMSVKFPTYVKVRFIVVKIVQDPSSVYALMDTTQQQLDALVINDDFTCY